ELALTSKTNQVFVGTVDEKFASAVVMVDIDVRTKDGATSAPATLLRLALAKIDGEWKVTRQYASGANDQTQSQNQLPGAPGGEGVVADLEVGRHGLGVPAGGGDLERLHPAAALGDRDHVAGAEPVGRPVDAAAVDQDVPVHDELPRLVDGAGEPGAQDQGVQPALQVGEQRVTGLARRRGGLGEG